MSVTKKTVELRPLEWTAGDDKLITERYVREGTDRYTVTPKEVSASFDRYDERMRSFEEMVQGKKEKPWDYDYELELYRIIMETCRGL